MDKQQRYELYKGSVGAGWWPVLDKYVPKILEEDPDAHLYIKEKYGLLRIEMYSKIIPVERHIELEGAAELESAVTCEFCGRPGKHRPQRDWMLTLCDECHNHNRKFREAAASAAEKKWLEGEPLHMEKYEKASALFRWDLKQFDVDFEIDDELRRLIEDLLDAYTSTTPFLKNPIYHIHVALAERLADRRLTNGQVKLLYRKFVKEAGNWAM